MKAFLLFGLTVSLLVGYRYAEAQSYAPPPPNALAPPSQDGYYGSDEYDQDFTHAERHSSRGNTRFELTPFVGYQVGGSATTATNSYHLGDGPTFGAIADFHLTPETAIECSYTYMDSALNSSQNGTPSTTLFNMGIHYLQLGGVVEYPNGRVRPFFGATLGATIFSPDTTAYASETRFSFGLSGGVKYMISKHVGLRASTRLNAAFLSTSSAIFCGGAAGCSYSFFGTGIAQVEFAGGLVGAF